MKKLFLFGLLVVFFANVHAQVAPEAITKVPRLYKTQIGDAGMKAYLPSGMEFEKSKSDDGSDVYTAEIEMDKGFNIGCIGVEFAEPLVDATNEELSELLVSYMDFLKTVFVVTGAAGYGKGHTLDAVPGAQGILDYWEDDEEQQIVIKGWITKHHICVLFIYGDKEFPVYNFQNMYLEGFREE